MSATQSIYDASPVFVQNLAISAYGLWLRRLRYGRAHAAVLADLMETRHDSPSRIRDVQSALLSRTITNAKRDVPHYRSHLKGLTISSVDQLRSAPLLTKDAVRSAGMAMVSTAIPLRELNHINTGGTTGSPLRVYCHRNSLQTNYAFFERFKRMAGISESARVATLAGRTIVPPNSRAPYWRHNWAARTLLCSSYHLGPDTLGIYLDALAAFNPSLIDSYPSSLDVLARHAIESGESRIHPHAIITSSETLLPSTRLAAESAFGCTVFDHYGAAEMAAFITQCRSGRYHVNPEYGIVEVLVDGRPAQPGERGDIVATGFINPVMPLIRYVTGDTATMGERGCGCGSHFPTLESIEGRSDDMIVTPDGRLIGRLDPIFKSTSGIYETRIVQDMPDHLRVEVVPMPSYTEHDGQSLRSELQRRVGPLMRISLVEVQRLPRTSRGKLRAVVNLLKGPTAHNSTAE